MFYMWLEDVWKPCVTTLESVVLHEKHAYTYMLVNKDKEYRTSRKESGHQWNILILTSGRIPAVCGIYQGILSSSNPNTWAFEQ